jgi:AcrR family transcriptional regulator
MPLNDVQRFAFPPTFLAIPPTARRSSRTGTRARPSDPGLATGVTGTLRSVPRAQEILRAARALLEERGADGLRMRPLADRLGVKAPSLYKHFASKRQVENALIATGLQEQADAQKREVAAAAPEEEIAALWDAYRRWALENPALHTLVASRALDRDDPAVAAAERPGIENVLRTTRGETKAALAFWAFAYGMVALEINERFPSGQDLDAVWDVGLRGIASTLPPG